ncbi:MAG: isoprenylcysteine carboxylmethyltransferase family protein [Betaproteobacteria bacterium]|nr:isoprenylcysteine carboxylmethyltransferase family protein [Betaproteobacteria bacterium]MDH4325314.1 isoprenylcysteine carboxylmethyltransferase family protein [Betaproteobacteria bacterium]MDH5578009.1 isoprenylcysteine carboxylmethyltransferase family protein [Betaproteobacteria bacterium]
MKALELKIPPPVVALLVAGGMWGIARLAPLIDLPQSLRVGAAIACGLAGVGLDIAALVSFQRARTTFNPMKVEKTSALVRSGVYRLTRNPMYLGSVLMLVAWAVYLSSAWALLGIVAFVLYLNRFQIAPEERALASKFGVSYAAYRSRVRRWL